jgi:hypothetical protein
LTEGDIITADYWKPKGLSLIMRTTAFLSAVGIGLVGLFSLYKSSSQKTTNQKTQENQKKENDK